MYQEVLQNKLPSKSTVKMPNYHSILPVLLLFSICIIGIFTTYIFQNIEDDLDNEILVVEHQIILFVIVDSME